MGAIVGVIGAGTMGRGIAQVAASAGLEVLLHDISTDALREASSRISSDLHSIVARGLLPEAQIATVLGRIHPRRELRELAESDLIIEAAAEDLELKKELFRGLDCIARPHTILATNTSSLSVTALASVTRVPASVVGMHFFNPPARMKLVEIIRTDRTSVETIGRTSDLARAMGKTPILCNDSPGFIVNRIARPFYGEALRLLGEGVSTPEEIDRIVRLSANFRMGPFELMDLIGIDVNYAVTQSVYERSFFEPRFRPHPIQRQMVEAGMLGRKSGKGFYSYG
ncbi:MAG TPA: 3-hydroxyacyl-CoA dehydrogenase NAD-binding domain-containing protein [Bacteroidota bacterium]|nr:3-hydroxyacyl-CoA dehydrogenase NAD-binding domain-containing protein [Bacteroidota bacterium]